MALILWINMYISNEESGLSVPNVWTNAPHGGHRCEQPHLAAEGGQTSGQDQSCRQGLAHHTTDFHCAWTFFSFLSKLKRLMFDYLFGWASLKAWAQWTILITVDSASCPLFSLALGAIPTRKYWKSTNTTSLAYNPMSAAQINHLYPV